MVNPGAFSGSRFAFLTAAKPAYNLAVQEGREAEYLTGLYRQYLKRYPIELPHTEEPSAEHLAAVDDDAPDPEHPAPDPDAPDFEQQQKAFSARSKEIRLRKEQIKRWMVYQRTKGGDNGKAAKKAGDPYNVLLQQLTGLAAAQRRARTGFNVWAKENEEVVNAAIRQEVAANGIDRKQLASVRTKVKKRLFMELPQDVQDAFDRQGRSEFAALKEERQKEQQSGPSTRPHDRQACIEALPKFVLPILDGIAAYTGWKVTLIAGGPEPADAGRLNVVSIHSGTTEGNVKANFGQLERQGYKQQVVPLFGRFLKRCYGVEECRSRAIVDTDGPLRDLLAEEISVNVDSVSAEAPLHPPAPSTGSPSLRSQGPAINSAAAGVPSRAAPTPKPAQPSSAGLAQTGDPAAAFASRSPSPAENPLPFSLRSSQPPSPPASPQMSQPPSPEASRAPSPVPSVSPSPEPTPPLGLRSTPAPGLSSPPSLAPSPAPVRPHSQDPPRLQPSPVTTLPAQRVESDAVSSQLQADLPAQCHPAGSPRSAGRAQQPSRKRRRDAEADGGDVNRGGKRRVGRRGAQSARAKKTTERNASPPRLSADEALANAPAWMASATKMLTSLDLGPQWALAVERWQRFEAAEGYEGSEKLKTTSRPPVVAAWIKHARTPTFEPKGKIASVSAIESDFWLWWGKLQPPWREKDAGGRPLKSVLRGDWEELRRPGVNGLLSVLAALFFWGRSVNGEAGPAVSGWQAAVTDVAWVLEQLVA